VAGRYVVVIVNSIAGLEQNENLYCKTRGQVSQGSLGMCCLKALHVYLVAMRVLTLVLAVFAVLIPELACFLPSEEMTQAEMECCEHMAADCGGANMQGYKCCPEIVRPDVAMGTRTHREFVPFSHIATFYVAEVPRLITPDFTTSPLAQTGIHAPPGDIGTPPTILRI